MSPTPIPATASPRLMLVLASHICVGAKKIFAHEHTLYTNAELAVHVPSVRRREKLPAGTNPADVEGGIHPLCEFCNECFFSDEELYPHMRDRHEKCFVCERNGNRFVYFRNYEELVRNIPWFVSCLDLTPMFAGISLWRRSLPLHSPDVPRAKVCRLRHPTGPQGAHSRSSRDRSLSQG